MSNKYAKAVGYDLGTTNCCVGIYDNEKESVVIINNENGSNTTPSYVAFLDGMRIVGQEAKNVVNIYPESVIYGIKRFMGKSLYDKGVQDDIDNISYNIITDVNGKLVANVKVINQDDTFIHKYYQPVEISAMLLGFMFF